MKIKILYILAISLLCSAASAFAYADDGKISGKVVDAATNEPIDFAAVNILKQDDDTPVKNYMTEHGGLFELGKLPYGTYKVKFTYIGYTSQVIEQVSITPQKPAFAIGTIRLKADANILGEVTVTESKPQVQFGADTITFNVDQSLLAQGSTASDLLKNVPMVDVDIDGKATIAGKRNTRIFIDGKPSDYITSNIADLMSVLPSDAIEKIEVITNPDVKYSSDGEGIINIVLKKGYKIGLNGTLSFNAGTRGVYNANAYAAYRTETFALTSSYGYRNNQNVSNSFSLTQNYKENVLSSHRNQYNNGENDSQGHNLRSGIDWDIKPTQNLRVSANVNYNGTNGDTHSDDHRLNADYIEQELRKQHNDNKNSVFNYVFNADYSLKLNKSDKLEASITSNANNADQQRYLERSTLHTTATAASLYLQHNQNTTGNQGLEFNAGYNKAISKIGGTFSAGAQATLHKNDNDQLITSYNFNTGQDTINPQLTNRFIFYENIYAAYGSLNIRTKKSRWSFRLGGRAELTDVRFEQSKGKDNNLEPYISFFPNLSVNKTFRKKYNTGISYSVRINRPRDFALNPLVDNSNPASIFAGNPSLKPSFTHQFELSFGTYGSKWSVSPRVGYSKTVDIIERIRTVTDSTGNTFTTYQNLASSDAFNFSIFGNYRPTKKITTNAGFTLSRVAYHSLVNTRSNRSGLSYRSNVGLAWQLPKKIAFEGNLNYYNNASAQGRSKGSVTSSFGARKIFFQNKLTVRLMAADPFSQQNYIEYIEGLNYKQQRQNTLNTRNFSAALSYRFTKVGRNTLNKQKQVQPDVD